MDTSSRACCGHRTAVNGGLKVAFFLGFRAPCVAEERMSRYQVW